MTAISKTHALKDNLSAVKARKVRSVLAEQHPRIDYFLDKIDRHNHIRIHIKYIS